MIRWGAWAKVYTSLVADYGAQSRLAEATAALQKAAVLWRQANLPPREK